jgi:hypothetical protein
MQIVMERAAPGVVCGGGCGAEVIPGQVLMKVKAGNDWVSLHPGCLAGMAEKWAEVQENAPKGRRKLDISPEVYDARMSLIRRYAAVNQRIREYRARLALSPGDAVLQGRILRYMITREEYKVKIAPLGGVPRRWSKDTFDIEGLAA